MKNILFLIILIVLSLESKLKNKENYEYSFSNFIKNNNKLYSTSEEYAYRLKIFSNNLDHINLHNSKKSNYQLGINKYADLTNEEFTKMKFCNCLIKPNNRRNNINNNLNKINNNINNNNRKLPDEIDWTKQGAVTMVKNQGGCGSCWAFSAIGSLESVNYIKNKELTEYSEQQLVDCSLDYGNGGCGGGYMTYAFDYIKDNGICHEFDYPYRGFDGVCKTRCKPLIYVKDYVILNKTEIDLAINLVNQPISVAINAKPLQLYKSGIFDDYCDDNKNHGVLAVGFGIDNNVKYWKIKNSWGGDWGENGYFRMIKDIDQEGGQCGIAEDTTYPII